jgi:3-deoxy-7-phosphoheptulonate synthase
MVRIGRIAGQYAKPRSARTAETRNGTMRLCLSYYGDLINRRGVHARRRARPDPQRLSWSRFYHSALTLNFICDR